MLFLDCMDSMSKVRPGAKEDKACDTVWLADSFHSPLPFFLPCYAIPYN